MSEAVWKTDFDLIQPWLDTLPRDQITAIEGAVAALKVHGPNLKRPLVGEVHESWITNLKELRPAGADGKVVRILFVFDPQRRAIGLYGGIKGDRKGSGRDPWKKWYRTAIKTAEQRYAEHLDTIEKG
jgi:hypothetical protein